MNIDNRIGESFEIQTPMEWIMNNHLILRTVSIPGPPDFQFARLFRDLDTSRGTKGFLDITVDGELTSSESSNHEETSTNTSV